MSLPSFRVLRYHKAGGLLDDDLSDRTVLRRLQTLSESSCWLVTECYGCVAVRYVDSYMTSGRLVHCDRPVWIEVTKREVLRHESLLQQAG